MKNKNENYTIPIGDHVKLRREGKKGRWKAHFTFRGAHAKESMKTSNLRKATKRAWGLETALSNGTYKRTVISTISPTDWFNNWITLKTTEGRAQSTIDKCKETVNGFVETLTSKGIRRMSDITAAVFHDHRLSLKAKGNNENTIYIKSMIIKSWMNAWVDNDPSNPPNPLKRVRLSKPRVGKQYCPPLAIVQKLLAAAPSPFRNYLMVLAYTGCRVGELRRLRVMDVDLVGGDWINIVSNEHGNTKTRESRKVPIHAKLRSVLVAAVAKRRGDELLFPRLTGSDKPAKPISEWHINHHVQVVAKQLNLTVGRANKGIVAHSLRHFFKSYCINSGVPRDVVDCWQGHTPSDSPSSAYYSITDVASRQWMDTLSF